MNPANEEWYRILTKCADNGKMVKSRGHECLELQCETAVVNMRAPVVTNPSRAVGMRMLSGEAYWILSGSDRVEDIEDYATEFFLSMSDDGETFSGAYGPRIGSQVNYVLKKLSSDPGTRQATMTIWDRNPKPSKDIPCTIGLTFMIREGKLNLHVAMRSSDIWLGLTNDIYCFSMAAHAVCARLPMEVEPGTLYLTAASSHIYTRNMGRVNLCLKEGSHKQFQISPPVLHRSTKDLMAIMKAARDGNGTVLTEDGVLNARWWEG